MKAFIGQKSIDELIHILERDNIKSVLIVCGTTSFVVSGARNLLIPKLSKFKLEIFDDFNINPRIEDIEKGLLKHRDFDAIIAVGGGSVIDVAKSINILSANAGLVSEYVKGLKKITKKGKLLIAIPTTAGSGSESTSFAVVYIGNQKYSLSHEFILPDYSILYPKFTYSMPKYLTAVVGMDALSQSIESYWSVNSTSLSRKFSIEALRLSLDNIETSVKFATPKSRDNMLLASHLSGKAINISKTTSCHAISYAFTSYFNIPHGHAVSLTLPDIFEYNMQIDASLVTDQRWVKYVKKIMNNLLTELGVKTPIEGRLKLEELIKSIGLELNLRNLGIKSKKDIDLIVNNYNVERGKNNPRSLDKSDLMSILVRRM